MIYLIYLVCPDLWKRSESKRATLLLVPHLRLEGRVEARQETVALDGDVSRMRRIIVEMACLHERIVEDRRHLQPWAAESHLQKKNKNGTDPVR